MFTFLLVSLRVIYDIIFIKKIIHPLHDVLLKCVHYPFGSINGGPAFSTRVKFSPAFSSPAFSAFPSFSHSPVMKIDAISLLALRA